MSTNNVQAKAFYMNQVPYYSCPKDVAINCGNAQAQGTEWFIPTVKNGVWTGYIRRKSSTKPTADSVKTVRVKDFESGSIYWLLIADNATEAVFNDACAVCCDVQAPLPTVTVPAPILEEPGCLINGTYQYFDITRALVGAEKYGAYGAKNGVAFTPASPTNLASLAALVTWANTNWAAYGTFAAPTATKLTFTSANATSGAIHITIQ